MEAPTIDPQIEVGSDRLEHRSGYLLVRAAREMPDWEVRTYRRTAVFLEETRYAVRGHEASPQGQHLYQLVPWPDDGRELPGRVIHYDADYVAERDERARVAMAAAPVGVLIRPLMPLLGLLPAGVKLALHQTLGVHPVAATRASIFMEWLVGFLAMVYSMIYGITGAATPELRPMPWIALVLLVDAGMRFGRSGTTKMEQYGFGEWLLDPLKSRED